MTVTRWRKKWTVDFTLPSGQRVRRVSPVQTKRGAEEYALTLRHGLSTSMPSSTGPTPTFREFAVEWLATYAVANNRPSEVVAKESILRVHLIPFFDNRKLEQIGPRDIEAYKALKLHGQRGERHLSAKSINNHLVVLRKCLVTAIEWGFLDKLPTIRRLPVPPAKFDWLNQEESQRFLAAIAKHYPQWEALFWLALRTGMRRGELFALSWGDVDLVAGRVTVRHSVYRGRFVAPKSGRERTIPLTHGVVEVVQLHRADTLLKGELVFPGKGGGLTLHQDHVDRPLHGALKLAGLRRLRFHDLRHSFASQLASAGRSLKEVQELLGHQSIQMTMRYAHLAPGRLREAVEVLESYESRVPVEKSGTNLEHPRKSPAKWLHAIHGTH